MDDLEKSVAERILSDKKYSPFKIPFSGWMSILFKTVRTLIDTPFMLVAAGCAFYSTLSLFPSISSLISIYGLAFDPMAVEPQLAFLKHFLPPSVYVFLKTMIHNVVDQAAATLTIQLGLSIILAIWASAVGTKGLITGLNVAYNSKETRNFFKFQIISLSLTFCAILGTILTLAIVVAVPAILKVLPMYIFGSISEYFPAFNMVRMISNIIVLFFVIWTFSLFYRFGPCRFYVYWRWICPGAIASTLLWLLSAFGFSFYVAHIANFGTTYGPLGTIVAIMMWFLVACYVVLLGAQLNSKIEEYVVNKVVAKEEDEAQVSNTI